MAESLEVQARDHSYPSRIAAEHVYLQLTQNFPPKSISWVRRAQWVGPVNVSFNDIDDDDIGSWAASSQPKSVNRFARDIKAGRKHVNPSILVARGKRFVVIDGHHRVLARHKLGMPILAYVGRVSRGDQEKAEQTHSSQYHSGPDMGNR